jgi:predicted DsbA family dithiol-disulfide isomerase
MEEQFLKNARTHAYPSQPDLLFRPGKDVSSLPILIDLAARCGLDGDMLADLAAQPAVKQGLLLATEAAIAAGVFGVPTFRVDDALFWGSDRIDTLLWHLQGHCIDDPTLEQFLARPALAKRNA